MKKIPLTQGKFALVDDKDYEYINRHKWYAATSSSGFCAVRKADKCSGYKTIYMHREILSISHPKLFCDHIDGNPLNNQRHNIRICSHAENACNRRKQTNNASGFKGVHWNGETSKWRAKIYSKKKFIHLGYFADLADAARAYNEAAKKYHGEFANLNEI